MGPAPKTISDLEIFSSSKMFLFVRKLILSIPFKGGTTGLLPVAIRKYFALIISVLFSVFSSI